MNSKIFFLLLWIFDNGSFQKIVTRNTALKSGDVAFRLQKYDEAAQFYQIAIKQSVLTNKNLLNNYAKSLYLYKKNKEAIKVYTSLLSSGNSFFQSDINLQLGNLFLFEKDTIKALEFYKNSLKLYPNNQLSAYNYEIIIRTFKSKNTFFKKNKKNINSNKSQNIKPITQLNQPDIAQKTNLSQETPPLKYNLTLEQAKLILDAMKNENLKPLLQNTNQYLKSKKTMSESW